jgi:plasmid stabilization system protein ParE
VSFRARVAPGAREQVRAIGLWWLTHRDKAPTLFEDELARALTLLAEAPQIGACVRSRRAEVRRLLLRASGFHVYYAVDHRAELVEVLAVWHGARLRGPRL